MDERYRSRKFRLAAYFALISTIALFTHYIDSGVFASIVAIILGLYGGANVYEKTRGINN